MLGTGYNHCLYGRTRPGCLCRRMVSPTICAMNWDQSVRAMRALITVPSDRKHPMAVTRPMTSSAIYGNFMRGCSHPNGLKNSFSRAALNGSLEAPSKPVYTDANAVQMMRMLSTDAPGLPQIRCM